MLYALAQFLAAQGRAARVIVIDDSLSMAAQSAGKSALARAKEAEDDSRQERGESRTDILSGASVQLLRIGMRGARGEGQGAEGRVNPGSVAATGEAEKAL